MSSYVFISHKCDDHSLVYPIVHNLEARGVRCWIDERDIPTGVDWYDELRVKRHGAAAVIWVRSPASARSAEVLKELKQSQRGSQLIIPIEIAPISDVNPEWEDFNFLQAMRVTDPRWADRVADRILALDGFVSSDVDASESAIVGVEPPGVRSQASTNLEALPGVVEPSAENHPLVIVNNDGRNYQLDALGGLGETLVEEGESFSTADLGFVAVSADASAIATCTSEGEVELWTLGAIDAARGPSLPSVLPAGPIAPRLLAVERPLGQSIRVIAGASTAAYSVMRRMDGTWAALSLIEGKVRIISAAIVRDDVLFVGADGGSTWVSGRSKRPISLPTLRGVDAAVGADGRYYVAGWGLAQDGSPTIEVAVESSDGWERVHRSVGGRGGILRLMPDIVRQKLSSIQTAVAVQQARNTVAILSLA